jgi:CheY-like chemotaxis protein
MSRPTDTLQSLREAPEAVRALRAWRVNLEQDFGAPVDAVVQYAEMLCEDARERVPEGVLLDLGRIQEAARKVRALVREILQPGRQLDNAEWQKTQRHHIRNGLDAIRGCAELILEDAREQFLDSFVTDLQRIRDHADTLLVRLGELFSASASAIPAATAALPPRLAARPVQPAEKGRLLVVDDNHILRDVLCRRLQRDGHTVVTAASGREALQLVHEQPFDLILLDMMMPDLNGYETLAELKADARWCHIPVIVLSALDEIDSVVRCIEAGAEDYLAKPCDPVVLRARIGACLEKKRLRDREVAHSEELHRAKLRVDELLHVILPAQVVPELIKTGSVQPRRVENVAVLFADLVGFTRYCGEHPAEMVVARLQQVIEKWEALAVQHQVQKIKTIGDAMMAVAGLLQPVPEDPVLHCVHFGRDLIEATRQLFPDWSVRVGIHVGPVVAGVVGRRQYLFDVWGDTVNAAARMETYGSPGVINLSLAAWKRLANNRPCFGEPHDAEVKGLGQVRMIRFLGFALDEL